MYCPNCAKKIRSGDKFCANCATPVAYLFESDSVDDPKKNTEPALSTLPTPSKLPKSIKPPKQPKADRTVNIHIIIISAAVIAVAVVLLIFTILKARERAAETVTDIDSEQTEEVAVDNISESEDKIEIEEEETEDEDEFEDAEQDEEKVIHKEMATNTATTTAAQKGTFAIDGIKLYDSSGNVVAEGQSTFDSNRNFTSTGLFNDDGVLVQLVETVVDTDGSLLYSKTVTGNAVVELGYDTNKNIIYQNIDGKVTVFDYTYNENDILISQKIYDGSGALIERKDGLADQEGRIVRWDHYSSAGASTGWSDVVYSSDGMDEKIISYNIAGQPYQETEKSYDEEHHLRKVKTMSYDTMINTKTYYDENGCITRTESYVNQKSDPSYRKQEYTYREEDMQCSDPQNELPF